MRTKRKKTLYTIAFLFLLGALSLWGFHGQIVSISYKYRYAEEIETVRKYLHVLSEGVESEIRTYSTSDARFLRSPQHISQLPELLRKVELDSFHVKRIVPGTHNQERLLLITIHFGQNAKNLVIDLMLRSKADTWIMKSVTFSADWFDDEWY